MSTKVSLISGKLNGTKQTSNENNKQTGKDVKLLDGKNSINYKK